MNVDIAKSYVWVIGSDRVITNHNSTVQTLVYTLECL